MQQTIWKVYLINSWGNVKLYEVCYTEEDAADAASYLGEYWAGTDKEEYNAAL